MRGLSIGETDEAKAVFVQCAQEAANPPADDAFRDLIARALTEGWGRPAELSPLRRRWSRPATGRVQAALQPAPRSRPRWTDCSRRCRAIVCCGRCWTPRLSAMPNWNAFSAASVPASLQLAMQADAAAAVDERRSLEFCCALAQPVLHQRIRLCRNRQPKQRRRRHCATGSTAALASGAPMPAFGSSPFGCLCSASLAGAGRRPCCSGPGRAPLDALIVQQVQEPAHRARHPRRRSRR